MYIKKNQSNDVILTLNEKAVSNTHDWLFEFKNQTTGEIKYCSAVDISIYPDRYNEFNIIDNPTEDASNGTLNFTPTGSWTYKVYEMPVASPPSLTPGGYLAIAEEEECDVYDPNETTNITFDADEEKDNAVFNG